MILFQGDATKIVDLDDPGALDLDFRVDTSVRRDRMEDTDAARRSVFDTCFYRGATDVFIAPCAIEFFFPYWCVPGLFFFYKQFLCYSLFFLSNMTKLSPSCIG